MGRSPCCDKLGLKKGPWTPEEDQKLLAYIEEHGHGNWRALPTKAGLQRCGKSCRLRWTNYLRPDIKRGKFSLQEEQTIIQLHALLGNRWSAIATHLPKRTDNEIKNYWNTHLKKRLTKMGIDPVTHKPKNDALVSAAEGGGGSLPQSKNAANLSHMAQWESARLEAEARLVRQSKIRSSSSGNLAACNNNSSFGSPLSPDVHISDHHQIVPSMSPTHHSQNYLSMTTTSTADVVATASTTPARCLDVLKAWHGDWSSTSTITGTSTSATNNNHNNNNESILGIGMGLTGLSGGVGLGIESPTSTLSFSENAQPVVPTMGTGAVIEFMGHQEDHQHHHHHHHQEMVKEEGDHHQHYHHEWKRGYNNDIEMNNNSLSFSPSSPTPFHDLNSDKEAANDNDGGGDHDHGQGFMEGFTELLLSTKTSHQKTVEEEEEEEGGNNDNHHQNINANSNGNKAGSTSKSNESESDYFEDNKTYWNSILNLVNSSPTHSPMF